MNRGRHYLQLKESASYIQLKDGTKHAVLGVLRDCQCSRSIKWAPQKSTRLGHVLSLGSRGAIDGIVLDSLRSLLQKELVSKFEGDRLQELEDKLGMDSSSFGIQWNVFPFICSISSRSSHLDLLDMHENGTINLYDLPHQFRTLR